ncbi:hypothetical protein [Dactylosporangium sp. CS-033363]|uniref:hypothetical protein n=1 Tax=Dactylosporangium sp. CS-033363 TaxID=3239935 RepID=UPI003D8B1DA0
MIVGEPDRPVAPDDCVALAAELVARPFPAGPRAGPTAHLVPRRRARATAPRGSGCAGGRLGEPASHSFEADFERIVGGEAVPAVVQDLTFFSLEQRVWRRGGRSVFVVLGQFDPVSCSR